MGVPVKRKGHPIGCPCCTVDALSLEIPASEVSPEVTEVATSEIAAHVRAVIAGLLVAARVRSVVAPGVLSGVGGLALGITLVEPRGRAVPEETVGDHTAHEHTGHAA